MRLLEQLVLDLHDLITVLLPGLHYLLAIIDLKEGYRPLNLVFQVLVHTDRVVLEIHLREVGKGAQQVQVLNREDPIVRDVQHGQVGEFLVDADQGNDPVVLQAQVFKLRQFKHPVKRFHLMHSFIQTQSLYF